MKKKCVIASCIFALVACLFISAVISEKTAYKNIYKFYPDDTYKIQETSHKKNTALKKGDLVLFGKYKDQPLLWRVLDVKNGKALIQTEKIVIFMPFDVPDTKSCRKDISSFGSAEWQNSSLRSYLNSTDGFLRSFTENEQSVTEGDFFILSKKQIREYLAPDERRKTATAAAIQSRTSKYIVLPDQDVWWWTSSSAGTNSISVCTVTSSGSFYKNVASDDATGVCPAVFICSDQTVSSGSGTEKHPYYIVTGGVHK